MSTRLDTTRRCLSCGNPTSIERGVCKSCGRPFNAHEVRRATPAAPRSPLLSGQRRRDPSTPGRRLSLARAKGVASLGARTAWARKDVAKLEARTAATGRVIREQLQAPPQDEVLVGARPLVPNAVAGVASIILPGLGHLLQKRVLAAIVWLALTYGAYNLNVVIGLFFHFLTVASAWGYKPIRLPAEGAARRRPGAGRS